MDDDTTYLCVMACAAAPGGVCVCGNILGQLLCSSSREQPFDVPTQTCWFPVQEVVVVVGTGDNPPFRVDLGKVDGAPCCDPQLLPQSEFLHSFVPVF